MQVWTDTGVDRYTVAADARRSIARVNLRFVLDMFFNVPLKYTA
jgi:hypothetical protein